jgi:hypothetical protein
MNRIALAVSRQVRRCAVKVAVPRTCFAAAPRTPLFISARLFSGANEPFLDAKMVTERIMEVLKNFEKVRAVVKLVVSFPRFLSSCLFSKDLSS